VVQVLLRQDALSVSSRHTTNSVKALKEIRQHKESTQTKYIIMYNTQI